MRSSSIRILHSGAKERCLYQMTSFIVMYGDETGAAIAFGECNLDRHLTIQLNGRLCRQTRLWQPLRIRLRSAS